MLLCPYVFAAPALKYVFIDELPVFQGDQTIKLFNITRLAFSDKSFEVFSPQNL